jgi:hypothetical protein
MHAGQLQTPDATVKVLQTLHVTEGPFADGCDAQLACLPASKKMFCHQCAGHARVAVALPGRQWYAGPGSAVDRKLRMRSVWHAAQISIEHMRVSSVCLSSCDCMHWCCLDADTPFPMQPEALQDLQWCRTVGTSHWAAEPCMHSRERKTYCRECRGSGCTGARCRTWVCAGRMA